MMIRSKAGFKRSLALDSTLPVAPRLSPMAQPEQPADRNMFPTSVLSKPIVDIQEDVEVDLREVYFLVMHFLANGPCTRAFGQLWNELLSHKLLPRRYHAFYARDGQPSGDENDDGLSFPLSYRDVANRYPDITNNHLVDLLQQLLVNNRRLTGGVDSNSEMVTAADTPTILGSGVFSLLEPERNKQNGAMPSWSRRLRWPHWHADAVHGLMLRELGGGFARHHRAPSVRTASYVLAKPSVFFSRIQIIKKLRGHRNAVYCAIFDRNGQHVITGSDDRLVKIWSTETGLCLRSCRGHEGDITDLAVSGMNKLVASASNDFSIRVWRLPDGFPVSVLRGHGGAVTAIAFSPRQGCEHHLLSSSDDGTCRIWDARDSNVNSRVYMPDPKDSQSAARGGTQAIPPVLPPGNQILCCAFNADGSIFVTGSSDKLARVWNATKWNDELTGRPNYELDTLQGHENDVNYVQFSGCAGPTRPFQADLCTEDAQPRFKNTWSPHDSIVTCSRDGSAIIWTPRPRKNYLRGFSSQAKAGRWVKAYHLKVPPPPMPPQPPRPGGPRQRLLPTPRGVNMIVWSLDNRFVLAAIMDCRICVWNAVDGSLVHSLTGHDQQTYVLDVHPFNPRIAMSAGYDGRVIIWDIWDGRPIRIYDTQDFNLVDGNFSPDGSSLVVSDEVGQIYLFATGEGTSQKDAKYDQFFLGDFRPLVRDTHGNVLDQETQLPPHVRNIQDLLCDPGFIPYAEPYQTIYQQRRLGALGIDWQPPATFLQVGTDDQPYTGPPDVAVQAQVASPRHETPGLVSEGGNRWVEQPNEVDEVMDWEQDVVSLTEDSGSDYSASEESDDDAKKGDSSEEVETEEDEEEDEVREDVRNRLRRSSRNKRKAESVTHSSSGRRLKRKRYDDGEDTHGRNRRAPGQRKVKSSRRSSPPKAIGVSRGRSSGRHEAEPSTRPKRQAAKNALYLLSSIHDDDEEESIPQAEKRVSDHVQRAHVPSETHRVLRSRNREELDEALSSLPNRSRAESSDHGECSRRPRSQRKLVVKLRSSSRKVVVDSKPGESEGSPVLNPETDRAEDLTTGVDLEDIHPPLKKLLLKLPRPSSGLKGQSTVIELLEDNQHDGVDNGNPVEEGSSGSSSDSEKDEAEDGEGMTLPDAGQCTMPDAEQCRWKRGKAAKRARAEDYLESPINNLTSSENGVFEETEDKWRDVIRASGSTSPLPMDMVVNGPEFVKEESDHEEVLEYPAEAGTSEVKLSSVCGVLRTEDCNRANHGKEHAVNLASPSTNGQANEDGLPCNGSDLESPYPPQVQHPGDVRQRKRTSSTDCSSKYTGYEADEPAFHSGVRCEASSIEKAVLDEERSSQLGVEGSHLRPSSMNEKTEGPVFVSCSYREGLAGSGDESLDGSERQVSSNCSGEMEENSFRSIEKQSSLQDSKTALASPNQENDMMEGEADNGHDDDGSDQVGESVHLRESDDGRSEDQMSEGHEVDGSESQDQEPYQDIDSEVEEKRRPKRKQHRALRDLQLLAKPSMSFVSNDEGVGTRSRSGKFATKSIDPQGNNDRNSRKRTKDGGQWPWQNGAGGGRQRTRQGKLGSGRFRGTVAQSRTGVGSGSEQGQDGNNESERRGSTRMNKLQDDDSRSLTTRQRTSARLIRKEAKDVRDLGQEKNRGKNMDENCGLFNKDLRIKKNPGKPMNRKKEDLSWLLLTEVEAGTRYIPQFGDEVVYLRQGHQEFLDLTQSEERGPWHALKSILAVETCRITGLEYAILQDSGQTCCKLTLKFTNQSSKLHAKTFKLTLPELTNFPDFIVERSRYEGSINHGWGPRDRCQVWWRSDEEVGGGKWWDGRVQKVKAKSPEFPESPWDRYFVQYKLDLSNEPQSHSPWELFRPGNHWHDFPHIDEHIKEELLNSIEHLEKSCAAGSEDDFGLRCLTEDVEDPAFVNCTPLPLDLKTVKQRLEKDYYRCLDAFHHDIELLLVNAQGCHGKQSEMARKMQRLGEFLVDAISDEDPLSTD